MDTRKLGWNAGGDPKDLAVAVYPHFGSSRPRQTMMRRVSCPLDDVPVSVIVRGF